MIRNLTRNTILASHAEVADHAASRNKGLLGRPSLNSGEGLWIVPCESVHTFFMKFPIDLVYIDREKRVKKVRNCVGPWRLSACLSAHSIIELPAGVIRATQTAPGDRLDFSSAAPQPGENDRPYAWRLGLYTPHFLAGPLYTAVHTLLHVTFAEVIEYKRDTNP